MYDVLRRWTLRILKTPPEPQPPFDPKGDPASLRVFRAGRNYYRLRIGTWAVAQAFALGALIFWTAFLIGVEKAAGEQGNERARKRALPAAVEPGKKDAATGEERPARKGKQRKESWKTRMAERVRAATAAYDAGGKGSTKVKGVITAWAAFQQASVEAALFLPAWAFVLIWGLKIISGLVYLAQLPLTYAVRRLDYEMRWYMVTDRSLRLRQGVWKISEATMSFANIQQVVVSQGPVQRLLGLANVKVKSAGGGGGESEHKSGDEDMHMGLFHSVTNAHEIRDLILERLRRFREAGLGDPDEKPKTELRGASGSGALSASVLEAGRELAAEARALRKTIEAQG